MLGAGFRKRLRMRAPNGRLEENSDLRGSLPPLPLLLPFPFLFHSLSLFLSLFHGHSATCLLVTESKYLLVRTAFLSRPASIMLLTA